MIAIQEYLAVWGVLVFFWFFLWLEYPPAGPAHISSTRSAGKCGRIEEGFGILSSGYFVPGWLRINDVTVGGVSQS